jgi:hypothetical protein
VNYFQRPQVASEFSIVLRGRRDERVDRRHAP